jgi:thiol-disulfide isomerase/thioredoxin
MGGAFGEPSFEGYVGSFVAANPSEVVPEIPFFDANDVPHTLSEYRGKVVLVNFWGSWCPACIMEMPALDRLQAELGGGNFVVLAISQDSGGAAVVRRFLESHKLEHLSVLIDGQRRLGLAFNQHMLPTSMLLDPEGREVGRLVGPADWSSPQALELIRFFVVRGEKETFRGPLQ